MADINQARRTLQETTRLLDTIENALDTPSLDPRRPAYRHLLESLNRAIDSLQQETQAIKTKLETLQQFFPTGDAP